MSALLTETSPIPPWLKVVAVVAAIFGVVTLFSAGSIVLDYGSSRVEAGAYVPFVVWFNLAAGFAYVIAALGIWRGSAWAPGLSAVIALATGVTAIPFAMHVAGGGAFELRTAGALAVRVGFWVAVSIALLRSRRRT